MVGAEGDIYRVHGIAINCQLDELYGREVSGLDVDTSGQRDVWETHCAREGGTAGQPLDAELGNH